MDGDPQTCARSDLAYGPRAANILGNQRGWKVSPLAFPACSGATLDEFYNSGAGHRDPQLVQGESMGPSGGRFDVVTLSLGGNDVGFADLLIRCMTSWGKSFSWSGLIARGQSCDLGSVDLEARVDELMKGNSTVHPGAHYGPGQHLTLPGFYEHIVRHNVSAHGVLVVVGYPQLFADTDDWGDWRGLSCHMIDRMDADILNAGAEYLNEQLRDAVAAANNALGAERVQYVDRLALFAGHELCSGSIEYLNGLALTERYMHSFHPNEIGHQKTAEQVAGEVDFHLGAVSTPPRDKTVDIPATTRSPAAPIDDGASDFSIGDSFASQCLVAWPTAPTYTSDSIIMTMDCQGTPDQFLLTQVSYPDPNLPITPSTGAVQVEGIIVDYAESAYGPRLLVVQADSVTW